jgi:DNA repair protein RAD50
VCERVRVRVLLPFLFSILLQQAGHSMVVVRSMELSQKKTTSTFRQLDGVLRTQDPNGVRRNISHKCTELDRQVPQLMGVSKAILDYVLFCHQEDSSWPLQDSAVLKKRFDEIFDSSRYTKAIEVLRKKEKSYISLAKDIKVDLAGLQSHKHAAQGFRNELETLNENLEELEDTKKDALQKLASTEDEIANYREKIDAYEKLDNEIDVRKNELYQTKSNIQTQRELLDEDMTETHTLDELQTMLREFDDNTSSERDQIDTFTRKVRVIQSKISDLEQEENQLKSDMAQWEAEKKAHDKRLRSRNDQMESIVHSHAVDLDLTQTQLEQSFVQSLANNTMSQRGQHLSQESLMTVTADEMGSFFESVEKKEQELSKLLADHKQKIKADDSEYYATVGALNSKMDIVKNGSCRGNRPIVIAREILNRF